MGLLKVLNSFTKNHSKYTRISIGRPPFGQRDIKTLSVDADNVPLSVEYDNECFNLVDVIHNSEVPDKDIILMYRAADKYFKIEKNDLLWRSY